ncbi:cytochrome c oxidase accessory protein CcoG [Flavihumibacter fluvii]|uniref:cytochrome c oxidase accessory protein CcoG n=1 Tax=Flavihumibacter fluvii TaxID=2838157 RepID=UPI001BDDF500|nr:cytochrome c oxidase accessory protein CcoG [Flavihumibacter fluvii]ULQ50829.1 cytochrome c oxidase accessory protein CcoG [Flavihumibacter fluvii]
MLQEEQEDISFRDRLATIDERGKRKWIFAQKPKGHFTNLRTYVSWGFFLLFLSLPFIEMNGRPFFLFNIPDAKFIIFGKVFWPQDFFIFGLTMVSFVIFIVLFTAAFGRLFCGWVCPQTIFMEMVFRKLEYLIEGDASTQRLLKNGPWNTEKIVKKVSKHLVFFLMSFIIANFFLAYIIGIRELWKIITEPVTEHFAGFVSLCLFSGVFYGVYAFFREQVCTVVCPYGRLQGVLLDRNSLIVAYDYKRGEPRGKVKEKEALSLGDCIDCLQCVKVCPTGIDIRNGTQLECINCTACIDACDNIMEKVGRPKGLIRYASENGIENSEPVKYTTRMKLYTALLMVLLVILSALLLTRKDIDATIMRTPGMLFQERGTDSISNLYNIKVVNKTMKDVPMNVGIERGDGKIEIIGGGPIIVKKEGQGSGSFFIVLPKKSITSRKTVLGIVLLEGEKVLDHKKTNFLGPINQ